MASNPSTLYPVPGADFTLPMDEFGGVQIELEGPAFRPAPIGQRPASRVTPPGGEKLPQPVDTRASIRAQQAENRIFFYASCLVLVLGIALFVPSVAALLVPVIGGE